MKTGWTETAKGQPGKPNVRARWVAMENETHARPELYASTPPLEALKAVLSEVATGKRGRKVVDLSTCEGLVSTLRREGEHSSNCRQRIYQARDEHKCGLLRCHMHGTFDAVQIWEEELASTLSDLKLTRGIACPCVWQG